MPIRSRTVVPLALTVSAALIGGVLLAESSTTASGDAPGSSVVPVSSPVTTPVAVKKPKSCSVGKGITAKQVVVVRSKGSRATVKACRRLSTGKYVVSLGPYSGHVGRGGVAKKGGKREGDGKTPSGTYKLRGGFGKYKNPGVRFSWFKTDSRDRWVDDSNSKYYNLHKRAPANGRWNSAEKLRAMVPAYNYVQVIGYNEKRTPGRGSAIFLHVDTGRATAGCVSIKQKSLLKILRWEKPGAVMSIQRAKS